VRLAKRMDGEAFQTIMDKVDEAAELDDERRGAAIAGIVDGLKSDFSRDYMSDHAQGFSNAVDMAAARSNLDIE
jgi:hypothetical protein